MESRVVCYFDLHSLPPLHVVSEKKLYGATRGRSHSSTRYCAAFRYRFFRTRSRFSFANRESRAHVKAQRPNVVASGRHLPNHRNMSATDDQFLHYQIFGAAGYGAGASRRLALARRAEAVMSASDNNPEDDRVVSFPGTEEQARAEEQAHVEEQARRFHAEVVRMAMLPESYWLFLISSDHVKKFGATKEQFEQAIRAVVAENEKKARETKADDRYERRRNEQEEQRKEREDKRKCRDEERTRKEEERARKEAERIEREQAAKRVKREAAFAEIVGLPKLTHEVRLKEAAARLGEDFAILAEEFEVFLAARTIPEDLEPWPEPVDTAELLSAIEAKFCRYVVATDALVTASTLFGAFTYVVEVATHAPKLIYTFPERDAGKSLAQDVLRWVVLRPYAAVEATGAAIYRIIDRLRPTLLLDEADTLFARRNVLAHIINASWSNSGRKVPRAGSKGKLIEEFDVYGAQLISMRGLNIPDTTLSRCIVCMIWPKLASERVEEFAYQDDDEFKVIRRKLLRWAVDNAVALRAAKPEFPPGFNNRIRVNWKMLLAIAALAGDEWLKRALHAALELEIDRDEPSEGIRLFQALQDVWGSAELWLSERLCAALVQHPSAEYVDFRSKGPITPHQLAAVLRPYGIRPIHGLRNHLGGYRRAQFENAWARLLQKPTKDSLPRSRGPGSPKPPRRKR